MRRILLKGWDGDGDPEEFIEMKKRAGRIPSRIAALVRMRR
jgi:hypothetical protein